MPRTPKKVAARPPDERTYASRRDAGRPIVSFTLPAEVVELVRSLAEREGLSRSAVVDRAVRELARRKKI